MSEDYGPLVRLWGLGLSQLPSTDAKGDDLKAFLSALLNEALPFIRSVPARDSGDDGAPWKKRGPLRTFPHSTAPVQLYSRVVAADSLRATAEKHKPPPGINTTGAGAGAAAQVRPEAWALRRSVHEDAAIKGSASWGEFVRCFKEKHAEAEVAFTPNIAGTKLHREWDCAGIQVEVAGGGGGGENRGGGEVWTDWTLKHEESLHQLPSPLNKRVFPVLQATAAARGRREFLVVQVATPGGDSKDGPKSGGVVRASYTSVELVRETDDGAKIEWTMGTASNAGGALPQWVQRLAVPGQIAKDVDMFLRWVAEEREQKDSAILRSAVEGADDGGMTTVQL